ncbi:ribosome maturation factor RimM [Alteribacillus iranensis]|uniref:Ribosome maturation factor RimM n=1 Tax=Alteribacillus iranensis TaxID=930128 RepID=A0A1I2A9M0_9BACI|nr:ribosome maturation factor RimM [Alteribacillus iranensis]SFE39520.1 16S rRNA processing protein RimM [Alteribacillus iranensis]
MEWFNVGKIINTHGVRGELKILPITDFVDDRFQNGNELFLFHETKKDRVKVTIERSRSHKQFLLLTVTEINTLEEAETWKGGILQIPETALTPLEEGEYYYHEIIGCTVYTEEEKPLGEVDDILSPGANDVWVVKPFHGEKEILIPYIKEVVKEIDVEKKRISIQLMEGLLP